MVFPSKVLMSTNIFHTLGFAEHTLRVWYPQPKVLDDNLDTIRFFIAIVNIETKTSWGSQGVFRL